MSGIGRLVGNAKHGVFVRIERYWPTMRSQIQIERFKVAERAFRLNKPQLNQRTGRIIDEDEQSARIASILAPAVIRAVNLDQFTKAFRAQSGLIEGPSLFAGQPDTIFLHPLANRRARDFEIRDLPRASQRQTSG